MSDSDVYTSDIKESFNEINSDTIEKIADQISKISIKSDDVAIIAETYKSLLKDIFKKHNKKINKIIFTNSHILLNSKAKKVKEMSLTDHVRELYNNEFKNINIIIEIDIFTGPKYSPSIVKFIESLSDKDKAALSECIDITSIYIYLKGLKATKTIIISLIGSIFTAIGHKFENKIKMPKADSKTSDIKLSKKKQGLDYIKILYSYINKKEITDDTIKEYFDAKDSILPDTGVSKHLVCPANIWKNTSDEVKEKFNIYCNTNITNEIEKRCIDRKISEKNDIKKIKHDVILSIKDDFTKVFKELFINIDVPSDTSTTKKISLVKNISKGIVPSDSDTGIPSESDTHSDKKQTSRKKK